MDLVAVNPVFNLYDQDWPLRTVIPPLPPAKFVFGEDSPCTGIALDSIVSHGCIISGGRVNHSVLSPGVRLECDSSVENSILFSGVHVGAKCKIKNAIIDHDLRIADGMTVGVDPQANRREGHTV